MALSAGGPDDRRARPYLASLVFSFLEGFTLPFSAGVRRSFLLSNNTGLAGTSGWSLITTTGASVFSTGTVSGTASASTGISSLLFPSVTTTGSPDDSCAGVIPSCAEASTLGVQSSITTCCSVGDC
ncbi:hypothetical protein BC832DRAFT_83806 [Gaertneriomyces semiglobifer]|nr:hypothetical protein BC832DRAFT_83806 [Gaertneriomyces semiglobifer]